MASLKLLFCTKLNGGNPILGVGMVIKENCVNEFLKKIIQLQNSVTPRIRIFFVLNLNEPVSQEKTFNVAGSHKNSQNY